MTPGGAKWESCEMIANTGPGTGFSWENMGNHANNNFFWGGPMIFNEICPKSHCFPDWVRGEVSNLDVEGALNAAEYNGTRPYILI